MGDGSRKGWWLVRRATLGVMSGFGLLVAGLALGGCARPATSAPAAMPQVRVSSAASTPSRAVDPAADTVAPTPPPCGLGVMACVRLSTGQAWLRPPGRPVVGPVLIGYGVGVNATPLGFFHVSWKAEHWVSTEYHEPMPYSVFFAAGGIAFHAGALDTSSHGCVHLAPSVAAMFFATLQPGDTVQVLP
jgi:lipoprotein-anchoring transpeptidase ErfK/SrfK